MTSSSKELQFTIDIAKEAGEILMSYFGTELTKNIKSAPNDYATEADVASEKLLLERIRKEFPDDAIVAEESGVHEVSKAKYTWIVDPLDGTYHFANNSEDFGVMIARAHGEILDLAVVWAPAKNTLASAELGKGAYVNGEQVRLNELQLSDKPLSVEKDDQEALKGLGYGITNLGASANTLITMQGERRAYVSSNGFIWDFAPPALLLSEAGWKVTNIKGETFRWQKDSTRGIPGVISALPELHKKITATISK